MIGNGNVAADVARMLALPREELEDDRHRRPRDRGAGRERRQGDRRARPPRPRPGRLHQPRGARARRDDPGRHRSSTRPRWSWTRSAAPTSTPRTATRPTAATSRSSPSSPSASPRARSRGSRCASCARRSRSRATARSSGSSSAATSSSDEDGSHRGQGHRRARDDRVRPGAALDRLHAASPIEGVPFDEKRGLIPNEAGRVRTRVRRAGPRPLRDRLDQARPLRRDRHQQEGLARHGHQPPRRPRGGQDPRARAGRRPGFDRVPARPSASPTTSPTRAGRRSTRPRSPPASPRAARASSSAASTRWSRPRSLKTGGLMAISVAEVRLLIEAALPGAEVEVVDETGTQDHLRADRHRPAVRGPLADRAAPPGQEGRARRASTTARSTLSRSRLGARLSRAYVSSDA